MPRVYHTQGSQATCHGIGKYRNNSKTSIAKSRKQSSERSFYSFSIIFGIVCSNLDIEPISCPLLPIQLFLVEYVQILAKKLTCKSIMRKNPAIDEFIWDFLHQIEYPFISKFHITGYCTYLNIILGNLSKNGIFL